MVNVLRLWGKNSVKHRFGYRWRVKRYLEATFSMGQMGHILRTNLTNILTMPNTTRMESKHNMVHVFVPMFSMFLQLFTCWYSLVRYLISFLSSVLPNLSLCVFACLFTNYWFPCFPNVLLGFLVVLFWQILTFRQKTASVFHVFFCFLFFSMCFWLFLHMHGFLSRKRTARYTELSIPATVLVCFNAICMLCAFF